MSRELLAEYPQATDRFDELFEAPQTTRAHWRALIDQLAAWPAERTRERLHSVHDQVRENGVTYNVYADPQGADRPWELDLLPMILPEEEWGRIEAAIVQRATLLNKVLLDVYGEQRLLKEGLLPPALVYGHAGYLRACHGARHAGDVMLHFYAADLARSPDGHWWVLNDRTQAPSGAGYALENRLAISRAMPDIYRSLKVERLATFFQAFQADLSALNRRDDSRVCVLTPGPLNETYFEHAYLARYLGFLLVEGEDLTVREDGVFIRTVSGLKRAEVLVRRLDADFADPLELNARSRLGVPGLVQAVRDGTVVIANSLGSGVVEARAMLSFLPALAPALLASELKLPNVATWWLGQARARAEIIDRLDEMVIASAFLGE